jgi:hypothetical protein
MMIPSVTDFVDGERKRNCYLFVATSDRKAQNLKSMEVLLKYINHEF